jgi:hypothetical protein
MDNAPGAQFVQTYSSVTTANSTTTTNTAGQAFFVVEEAGYLSQYFMASTPGHGLLKLYVEHCIRRLLELTDVDAQYVPFVTGPGALKAAFAEFLAHQQPPPPHHATTTTTTAMNTPGGKVKAGVYTGGYHHYTDNNKTTWTVTVAGKRSAPNAIVRRNVIYKKRNLYPHMNMTHFSRSAATSNHTNETCLDRIYRTTHVRLDTHGNVLSSGG